MPTPLPEPGTALAQPPERDEVVHVARGLKSAMQPDGGLTELQASVLTALGASMTGYHIDVDDLDSIEPVEFAEGLATRDLKFRTDLVHVMALGLMLLDEPETGVADRIIAFADELEVASDCLHKARDILAGSAQLVSADIDRSSYITELDLSGFTPLENAEDNVRAWSSTVVYPALADRWRSLGELDHGTVGRSVHDFYIARGFAFPGEPGSAPPLLAQHDWVHVLADYGSQLEAEIEVFAFMARASDNPDAFALLAMAISLFHNGMLPDAAGFFEADPGHMSADGMPERLADAFRRGACCTGRIDFIALDYFAIADQPVDLVRQEMGIPPKSPVAVNAGARSPFEAGGISESQLRAGRLLAEREGRPYDAFGASAGPVAPGPRSS